jgi:dTDP-4-dehydrorhamnose reductase
MADEKVAILGGRGMLGCDLARAAQPVFNTAVFDLPDFDITNHEQLEQVVKGAWIIVNCAAYTNVDRAETEVDRAYRVNAEAVGRLGSIAKQTGAWVLHISTDFVFDGKGDKPYVETDPPNPINTYGKSKLAGEKLLLESGCRCCIIRLEWTYGMQGSNFVTRLIKRAGENRLVTVVNDKVGSPTATTEAAKTICELLRARPEGVFHFAAGGYVSRFEMAEFVFDKLSMAVDLRPCKSSDYASPATRPLNSRFDCGRIKALLDGAIAPWQEPLEAFLKQL